MSLNEGAACDQRRDASDLGEDFVEVGRLSRIAKVTTRRQLEKGRRKGTHGGDRKEAGPALDPACTGSGPEEWSEAGRTVSGKVAKEGGSFSTTAPADLDPDNDETCPSCARELGVRLAARGAGRLRRPHNATSVADGNIDVHVSEPDVVRATRVPLSRQTRATACSSGRQHSGSGGHRAGRGGPGSGRLLLVFFFLAYIFADARSADMVCEQVFAKEKLTILVVSAGQGPRAKTGQQQTAGAAHARLLAGSRAKVATSLNSEQEAFVGLVELGSHAGHPFCAGQRSFVLRRRDKHLRLHARSGAKRGQACDMLVKMVVLLVASALI
eukprot:s4836_g5.t2